MSKMQAWILRTLTVILVLLQLLALGRHLWNGPPYHIHPIVIHTWPGSSSINCFLDDHLQFHHKRPHLHGPGFSAFPQSILSAHSTEDTLPLRSHDPRIIRRFISIPRKFAECLLRIFLSAYSYHIAVLFSRVYQSIVYYFNHLSY